nr:uncharacterized protein LOC117993213 [Maniola hyperantus]
MSDATIFSKMAGTEAMVRFVKEIERHPCLYDQRSLEYSNRELRRKTWTEIAKKYNSTVKECKDKWVKIRIAYVRTLRPGYNKERPRNPRSTYYLADHLQFITPGKNNSSNYSKSSLYSAENNHQLDEASEIDTKSNIVDEPLNDSDDKSDSKQYGNSQHQVFLDVDNNYFDDSKEYENSQDQVFLDEDNDYYDDAK